MRLNQATEQFLHYIARVRRLSEATQRAYASDLRQFAIFVASQLADCRVEDITTRDIEDFVAACGTLAARTVRRRLATVSSLWSFLERRGHVAINPVASVPRPREPRDEPTWFQDEQLQALLLAIDDPSERAVFLTFATAGLRRSEVLGLDLKDLDLEAGQLRVREGKGSRDRTVPLTDELADAVRRHLPVRIEGDSDALFTSSVGTRLTSTSLQRMFSRWLGAAGLQARDYSLHSLRHAAATRWIRAGLNIRDVQQLLGHEDVGTTSRYLHSSPDHVRREMAQKVPAIGAKPMSGPKVGVAGVEITPEIARGLALLGRLQEALLEHH